MDLSAWVIWTYYYLIILTCSTNVIDAYWSNYSDSSKVKLNNSIINDLRKIQGNSFAYKDKRNHSNVSNNSTGGGEATLGKVNIKTIFITKVISRKHDGHSRLTEDIGIYARVVR